MRMKRMFAVLLSGVMAFAVGLNLVMSDAAKAADDVIKWRIQAHYPSASSSYDDAVKKIANELKEKTDGRLVLEPYPASALVPSKEIFSSVQRGVIEGGTLSADYIRDKIDIAAVAAGLPFAFKNVWEAVYFHKHMGFEEMMREAAAEYGVYYTTDRIYTTELVTSKPVRSLEDFDGLKVRSAGDLQTFLTKIGATASHVPGSEIYTALSSGTFDGAHWGGPQGAYSMKLYEVCKYHIRPPLRIGGTDAWVFNQEAIDNLPDDIREIFYETMERHFWRRTNEYKYLEEITLQKAVQEEDVEVINLPPEEQKKITQIAVEMWDKKAEKSEQMSKAVGMVKEFLKDMGHL